MNTGPAFSPTRLLANRSEAGRLLAERLGEYANHPNALVLALPRGGVPVAYEIANALKLPLDVFVVKKISVPGFEEMALGAIASEGEYLLDENFIRQLGLSKQQIEEIAANAFREVQRRENAYRNQRPALHFEGCTAILVDDGLATGSSMQTAVTALRRKKPARIVVAVPVASREACEDMRATADRVVCVRVPDPFYAVGLWYGDFTQTTDAEVRDLLEKARTRATMDDDR